MNEQEAVKLIQEQIDILKGIENKIVANFEPAYTDHVCGIALTIKELEQEIRAISPEL